MFEDEIDDDDDFTPVANSKLASLFARNPLLSDDNVSLTYTPPKQPKKMSMNHEERKNASDKETPGQKLNILMVKAVTSYKLENGNYNSQGKLGVALLGSAATKTYQLLLYKGKQQHITTCRINTQFQFIVQANNYASFYDDQRKNWSIMFESQDQAIEFTTEVGLSRANAQSELNEILTQDLIFVEGSGASLDDTMELRYRAIVLTPSTGILGQEIESTLSSEKPQRVKLRSGGWEEGLIGVGRHGRRLLVIPYSLVTSAWRRLMPADTWLVLDVSIGRIKSPKNSKSVSNPIKDSGPQAQDSGESAFESSEDSSVKARTASISVALSSSPRLASKKATLISRMARMGQPTLPLPGSVGGPSDSEETEEETSVPPNTIIFRPSSTKPRINSSANKVASRPADNSNPPHHPAMQQSAPTSNYPNQTAPVGSMAIYQTMPWFQQQHIQQQQQQHIQQQSTPMQLYSTNPGPMTVTTPTAVLTPMASPAISNDSAHMTLYLAESRTQGVEMRMGLARVTDKVDQVISKLDSLDLRVSANTNANSSVTSSTSFSTSAFNSAAALVSLSGNPEAQLSSLQQIIAEKERLKVLLDEKQERLDKQNDRIYQLINTNQKLMEQSALLLIEKSLKANESSTSVREDNSLKESLEQINIKLNEVNDKLENKQQKNEIDENDIKVSHFTQQQLISLSSDLQVKDQELKARETTISDQTNRLTLLESSLQAALESQHSQEQSMSTLQNSLGELQANKEQLEMWLADTTRQLHDAASEAASKKTDILALEQRIAILSNKSNDPETLNEEVKRVMNVLYKKLQAEFEPGSSYEGSFIRQTLLHIIRDVTLNLLAHQEMNTNTNSPLKSTKETNQQQQQEQQHVPPEPKPRVTVILKPPPPNEPPETEKDSVSSENIKQTNEEESSKSPLPAIKENDQNKTDNLNDDKCKQNSLSAKPEVINQVDPLSAVETVISRSPSPAARSIKRDNSNQEKETLLERECRLSPPPQIFDDDDDDEDWLN